MPVLSDSERHTYRGLALLWLVAAVAFLVWWCWPSHVISLVGFLVPSFVVGYALVMPAYFFYFVGRMRRPNPSLQPPAGLRVAFATTFVPGSESLEVLARTIVAMRDQEGPAHDVWVLDEGDAPAVADLCRQVGARHFSRKGIARYQGTAWPFKARTKAGNYNAWLDWIAQRGIEYDVLLQMDTDHVPQPRYLLEMLRSFADPAVAYVAAPSITSANHGDSWVVGARYEVEATLHGALQMGYNGGFAPLIIGSHAAFRVAALRGIGGFQQTLAEDHHNTLRLNASGLRGVFSPDAIAVGDGADSFAAAMTQEYQWARALTQILLGFFARDGRTLRPRVWAQLLFAETWYPMFALSQAMGWLMPVVALVSGHPWMRMSYLQFVALHALTTVTCLLLVSWLRRRGWLRPATARFLTWRSALLTVARWPFVLMAVAEAVAGRVLGRDFPFRVTPKGSRARRELPLRLLLPYVVLVCGSLLAAALYLHRGGTGASDGYLYLALVSAAVYLSLILAVVVLNQRENVRTWRVPAFRALRMHLPSYGVAFVLIGAFASVAVAGFPRAADAVALDAGAPLGSAVRIATSVVPAAGCRGTTATALELAGSGKTAPAGSQTRPGCPAVTLPLDRPFIGIYDPAGALNAPADAEEVFVQWKPSAGQEVHDQVARIVAERRVPVITIEPYPWNVDGLGSTTLLADISGGRYDPTIEAIAAAVHDVSPTPVYLRFAHEMDLTGQYPWSQGDPQAYIAAYRHFALTVRATAGNARLVWSPQGAVADSASYYPGGDVVDLIGVTGLVATQWEATGVAPSFTSMLDVRYALATRFQKPIVISELGTSTLNDSDRMRWIEEVRASMANYPLLVGGIWFDARTPHAPAGTEYADWTLNQAELSALFAKQVAR